MAANYTAHLSGGTLHPLRCLIGISIGNPATAGQKLLATIALANRKFQSMNFLVADTLNRHHLVHDQPIGEAAAELLARQAGDLWLNENQTARAAVAIPTDFSRWDDWRHRPITQDYAKFLGDLFHRNDLFKQAVLKDVEEFGRRRAQQGQPIGVSRLLGCYRYLLEELAVDLAIAETDGPIAYLYPGKELFCYTALRMLKGDGIDTPIDRFAHFKLSFHRKTTNDNQRATAQKQA
ncbi:Cyclodileucine synthase [uncultured Caudovirales phage]|uniref:Cyclodileucine synthase n=1 Tax=uncultured Caudovirales phage TaxID=2100421 RepID=A0A6J5M2C3_9CAUD|nr:Cyclodileucine synthase [uncultured Caudovirales phage]